MMRSKCCLLLFSMLIAISSIFAPSASASSAFDDTISTTNNIHIASPTYSCTAQDYTSSWSSVMLNNLAYSSSWGQYIGGADYTEVSSAFEDALENQDGWAVSQGNYITGSSNGGGGAVFDDTINIQFSPSGTAYVDFQSIGSHTYAYMRTTDSEYVYNVRLSFYKPSTGSQAGQCMPIVNQTARWTGDKDVIWINNNLGGQNFSIASDWTSSDIGFVATANPFLINADVRYPTGYDGAIVPSEYNPPQPVLYSGTIDCGGETPQSMSVYQSGNWGGATLVSTSLGRADWSYSLTSSPYSFTVDCGGTLASSAGTVDPTTTSGDWVCDVYGTEPYYCVLS